MECGRCKCLRSLALSCADALDSEAEFPEQFAKDSRRAHGLGTAYPRPKFNPEPFAKAIEALRNERFIRFGMVDSSSLLYGEYNSLQFAKRLSDEIAQAKGSEEAEKAETMAVALREAADAMRKVANFGFIDCAIQEKGGKP